MEKLRYLIAIIIIGIVVFIGIEVFRKTENGENNTSNDVSENVKVVTENTKVEDITIESPLDIEKNQNIPVSSSIRKVERLKNAEELMQKAEKTLTARGWAGASNNVIGLKDEVIYYYNKATGEFYPIAEGIEEIYYSTDYAEEITAKKDSKSFKEIKEAPQFLVYE